MSYDISLPNLTAPTTAGQIQQIHAYLYQLAGQLNWVLNTIEGGSSVMTEEEAKANFEAIKPLISSSSDILSAYSTKLCNGVRMRTKAVLGTKELYIGTRYGAFGGQDDERQTFFLFGAANASLVYGVASISNNGTTQWSGTTGVTLTTKGGGILTVVLPEVANDIFTIISGRDFSV